MTKETIIENCQRLLLFYEDDLNIESILSLTEFTCESIIKSYAKILSINGAPSKGVSLIFIKNEFEYNEMKYYASTKDNFKDAKIIRDEAQDEINNTLPKEWNAVVLTTECFSFDFEGYNWLIKKK